MMSLLLGAFCASASAAPASPEAHWMKRYPARDYGAFWHLDLAVVDFAAGRRGAEAVLAKSSASAVVAEQNRVGSDKVKYMQWSYRLPRGEAVKVLEKLHTLGTVKRSTQNENLLPEVIAEVPEKLAKLKAERGAPALTRLPATSAAAAEILAHLEAVDKAWKDSADSVLLNISIEEEAK